LATENGLLVSKDKGATWKALGAPINICNAPNKFRVSGLFFGADENHILLVGMDGVFRTADGGASWKKVAPYPSDDPGFPMHSCFAWDPVHNIVYAARSGKPALLCRLDFLPLGKNAFGNAGSVGLGEVCELCSFRCKKVKSGVPDCSQRPSGRHFVLPWADLHCAFSA